MRNNRAVFWGAALGCAPWLLLFLVLAVWLFGRALTDASPKVGVVRITGLISGSGAGLLSGGAGSETVVRQLRAAEQDPSVKAILLRINSPGGSAAASQEICQEVRRIATRGRKKIVVSMGDVAASGGYYAASAANYIVANGSTLTGSIGVIMELPDVAALMKRYGVALNVIKSGKFKDIGNFARQMTPEERKLLQTTVMDVYDQFVGAVAEGRHMPRSKVLALADGRVFTGRQALANGLVDRLGGWHDALILAARQGGIQGEPKVKDFSARGPLSSLLDDDSSLNRLPPAANLLLDKRLLPIVGALPNQ